MARERGIALLLVLVSTVASADVLVLTDGRSFSGKVALEGETVSVELSYGTLRFPKHLISRIERKDTPQEELAKRLADISRDDIKALVEAAVWAARNGMGKQSHEIYTAVLKLDPDNPTARRALRFVRIDGKWHAFSEAMELAKGKLEAGQCEALLRDILPELEQIAATDEDRIAVAEITGQAQLRIKAFAAAEETFSELAEQARSHKAKAARFAATAEILRENRDGMYVVTEGYPSSITLSGASKPLLRAGPASLSRPIVLAAALRDVARKRIGAGRELMAQAQRLELTDPDAAAAKYAQASLAFNAADALCAGIARTYHVEIARRKIRSLRKDIEAGKSKFNGERDKLGRKALSPRAYRDLILRLIHHLDNVRDDLQEVLRVAEVYPRELVLERKLAEGELGKFDAQRKVLTEELYGQQ
jgi:hypothetical protein